MAKIKPLNTLIFLASTVNFVSVFFFAMFKFKSGVNAIRLYLFGQVMISVDGLVIESFNPKDLSFASPIAAIVLVMIGTCSLVASFSLLELRDFELSKTKPVLPYTKQKLAYRIYCIYSSVTNLLGFVGLMLYLSYVRAVKILFPSLSVSFMFIYLAIFLVAGFCLGIFRLIFPPAEMFQYIDRKIKEEALLSQTPLTSTDTIDSQNSS